MGVTLTQRHSTQAKPGHACMCPCVSSACALYYYAARPTNHPLLIPTGRLHTPPCLATMRTCRRMASDCRVLLLPSYARQCVVRLRARTYVPLVRTRQRCRVPAPTTPATASTPTITNANATSHARPRARNVTPRIKVPKPPMAHSPVSVMRAVRAVSWQLLPGLGPPLFGGSLAWRAWACTWCWARPPPRATALVGSLLRLDIRMRPILSYLSFP
jgi:hypothetical protein